MNTEQIQQSERIATKVLRALAVIGLVSVLALATWVVVQGLRHVPDARENLTAAVSAVTSIFRKAPEESLTFEIANRTIPVGVPSDISWSYVGNNQPETFYFSYTCGTDVTLSALLDSGWTDITCGLPIGLTGNKISILATNEKTRFADVMLTVRGGSLLVDTTGIAIVNTDISTTASTTTPVATTTQNQTTQAPKTTVPKIQPQPTQVVRKVEPIFTGPADLVLNIEETGVIVRVSGDDTFFELSPIPTNKVAAVKFTVTNKGGVTSDTWKFRAELPIEGDANYEYISPRQIPLASGMQIEFTLSFDELLEDDDGIIRIKLLPGDKNDAKANNEDSVVIDIKEV